MSRKTDADPHAEELGLARACAKGDARAIARFEAEYLTRVPGFVARISREPDFVDEVQQRLREKLLVSRPPDAGRIAEYAGRGPLAGWLRVAAVRAALDVKRERGGGASRADATVLPRDAELDFVRRHDGAALREALSMAIESLEAEDRAILRMRYVDGLTVERLGRVYGVHAATIVRRLAASRDRVVARVRERLFSEQRLRARDVESLAALVQSQLELSLTRLLGKSEP